MLTFLHSFEPGGVERIALRLHRAWCAAGYDSRLVMGRGDGAMRAEAGGLAFELLSSGRVATARWETLWMIVTLPRIIRRDRPDVLFCAGNSYTVVAVALKLMLGHDCPPIVAKISNDLVRADLPVAARWWYRRWLRLQARFLDGIVGIAEPMRCEIERMMAVAADRVFVVDDPAVDLADVVAARRILRDATKGTRFVGVGRLSPQKNFSHALRGFARIAQPGDTLTLYGEGPERRRLEQLAAELGIGERFHLPGFIDDLPARLARADVFVLSSDYEGVPAVIVEALAAGSAIVATDCSVSMASMLGYGRLGALVPVGDVAALAIALDGARDTVPDRPAMRAGAVRFTIEAAAPAWWSVLATVRARHRMAAAATDASPMPPVVAKG